MGEKKISKRSRLIKTSVKASASSASVPPAAAVATCRDEVTRKDVTLSATLATSPLSVAYETTVVASGSGSSQAHPVSPNEIVISDEEIQTDPNLFFFLELYVQKVDPKGSTNI